MLHHLKLTNSKTLGMIILVVLTLCSLALFTPKVMALSGSDFNPARIIDDVVFYNANSMTSAQIQQFLEAKVPVCDTNGTQPYAGTTRADYGTSRGYPPPYTCLKDYRQNITARNPEDSLCNGMAAASNVRASEIIYRVAQSCGVSPKVLLVLLQKEQSLVTDDWPWSIQYRSATGYGCPDTAACDSTYYGFYNQVYMAARVYKYYAKYPHDFNHIAGRDNYVLYNPDTNCGGSNVFIQNQATAGLYNYTPYQPNAAALNNLYGRGDGCSAYGNRNFWRMFTEWFGTTYGSPYYATYKAQSYDPSLNPGQSTQISITYRNAGTSTWYDDQSINTAPAGSKPTHLATVNPTNRASAFADTSWGAHKNRPTGMFAAVYDIDGNQYSTNPHTVKPGESVKFTFTMKVPEGYLPDSYQEHFAPVHEGGTGIIQTNVKVYSTVKVNPAPKANFVSQSVYPQLTGGESTTSFITYKNTGNTTWYDSQSIGKAPAGSKPTHLATVNPTNRASAFADASWGAHSNRPAVTFSEVYGTDGSKYSTNPHTVKPGESVKFSFKFTVPNNYTPGTYSEHFAPVHEGGSGIFPVTPSLVWLDLTVLNAASAKATSTISTITVNALTNKTETYQFTNTGSTSWTKDTTFLDVVSGDATGLKAQNWISNTRVAQLKEANVAPGAIGSFDITYSAPQSASNFTFKLSPTVSGEDIGITTMSVNVSVPKPTHKASYHSQSPYPTMTQNSTSVASFSLKNTGNIAWHDKTSASSKNIKPVVLAATDPVNRISKFNAAFAGPNRPAVDFSAVYESDGTTLAADQHVVQPGQIAKFTFTFTAPDDIAPGTYKEVFQPILEGGNPWGMEQKVWLEVTVTDATYSARFVSQSNHPTITPGNSAQSSFSLKNTGNIAWHDKTSASSKNIKPVVLAATDPVNRISKFNAAFAGPNRPAVDFSAVYESDGTTLAADQHVVQPGQIAKFTFTFTAPDDIAPGTYKEVFQPILEGGNPWGMEQKVWLFVSVP